jgi:hypothetical protein
VSTHGLNTQRVSAVQKAWSSYVCTTILLQHGPTAGVMISAFVSRKFGFGLKLRQEPLRKVNLAGRGTKCSDEAAAKETRGGDANEQPLAKSQFVVEFECGANNQGHRRCDHMVLQFEDCIDIVNTLWPQFDCVFLFVHFCGHDRQRPDGLTVTGLNKGLGGAQPRIIGTLEGLINVFHVPHTCS